ncbi:XRE family transcriptional regulator, partial [Dickeya dianthicola]
EMVCAFAKVLNVPECYFYTVNDDFADMILELYLKHQRHS